MVVRGARMDASSGVSVFSVTCSLISKTHSKVRAYRDHTVTFGMLLTRQFSSNIYVTKMLQTTDASCRSYGLA